MTEARKQYASSLAPGISWELRCGKNGLPVKSLRCQGERDTNLNCANLTNIDINNSLCGNLGKSGRDVMYMCVCTPTMCHCVVG
jgi:hypothetical protein